MGFKNSIMLNERCFLIVEGETEMYSLPIIFKKTQNLSLQAEGIRLLNGEGCGGVRSLAKFLNANRRNVIFLLDRETQEDPKGTFSPQKLQADGFDIENQVFFVGTKEFEDSFSDETYARAANSNWPKCDGSSWSSGEFLALRDSADFYGELVTLLRRETRTNISKPDIGRGLAKAIESKGEIPVDIVACMNQAIRLAV
jgi:hypothetical protein